MNEEKIPSILYKYRSSERAKDIVSDLEVIFSHPNELNDPSEWSMRPMGALRRDHLEDHFSRPENIYRDYISCVVNDDFNRGFDEYSKSTPFRKHHLSSLTPIELSYISTQTRSDMCKNYVLFCASSSPVENTLWDRYGANGEGVIIGLDTSSLKGTHCQVTYSDDIAQFELKFLFEQTLRGKNLHFYKTKEAKWAYEKEWRIISNISDCIRVSKNGHTVWVQKFPPAAIKEIIFGPKCSHYMKQEIIEVLKSKNLNPELKNVETDIQINPLVVVPTQL